MKAYITLGLISMIFIASGIALIQFPLGETKITLTTTLGLSYPTQVYAGDTFTIVITLDYLTEGLTPEQQATLNRTSLLNNQKINIYKGLTFIRDVYTNKSGITIVNVVESTIGVITYKFKYDGSYMLSAKDRTITVNVISKITPEEEYTLTITSTTGGYTDPEVGIYIHESGLIISVNAYQNVGFSFRNWNLDDVNVGSVSLIQVTMNQDHTLLANFTENIAPTQYTLSITSTTGGTTNPTTGSYVYDENTYTTVNATALVNYVFSKWILDGVDNLNNPITIFMSQNHNLQSVFTFISQKYALYVLQPTVGGSCNPIPGTYTYDPNTIVTLTATPESTYDFDLWQIGPSYFYTNPYQLTMNMNYNVKAHFKAKAPPPTYSVQLSTDTKSLYPLDEDTLLITLQSLNSFIGTVEISCPNSDSSITIDTKIVELSAGEIVNTTLNIKTADITQGTYTRTIKCVDDDGLEEQLFVLTINIQEFAPFFDWIHPTTAQINDMITVKIYLYNTYKITGYNFSMYWQPQITFWGISYLSYFQNQITTQKFITNGIKVNVTGNERTHTGYWVCTITFSATSSGTCTLALFGSVKYKNIKYITSTKTLNDYIKIGVPTGNLYLTAKTNKIYDFNGNGEVDIDDRNILIAKKYDLNGDGIYGLLDLMLFDKQYGTIITGNIYENIDGNWIQQNSITKFGRNVYHLVGPYEAGQHNIGIKIVESGEWGSQVITVIQGIDNTHNMTLSSDTTAPFKLFSLGTINGIEITSQLLGLATIGIGFILLIATVIVKKKKAE